MPRARSAPTTGRTCWKPDDNDLVDLKANLWMTKLNLRAPPRVTTVAAFTENASVMRTGFAVGGGAEYALSNAWSLKGEYLLAHFDEAELRFPSARAGVMIANGYNYPVTSNTVAGRRLLSKVDIPMVRVGLNYRF